MVALLYLIYQVVYFDTGNWVKPGGWLIIKHNLRVQYQRTCNTYTLTLPAR
jgi:hypothetical protein